MSSKKSRKVNWTRFIPGFDFLEARETPAGNITASLLNGVLIIRGTEDLDSFRISGTGEGSAVIRPLDGSTLNGSAVAKYFGGFRGIDIQTFGGTDQVIVENVNVSDFLSIDTGNDSDVVHIVSGTRSQDSTWVKTGAADDKVFIIDSRFEDHFALDSGDGNDRVSIERSRFTGSAFINGGASSHDGLGISVSRFDRKTVAGFEAQFNTPLPVGVDDSSTVDGAGTVSVNVLANDVPRQGNMDTSSVTITRQPTLGTAKVNTDGTISYTRTTDGGSDFLQYVAKNAAGVFTNETVVSFSLTGSVDTTAPTVTLTSTATDPTNTSPVPFTAVFNENVTGFTKSNISVVNGTSSEIVTVDAKTYTFTVTPTGQGLVSATILANAAKDSSGNSSVASSTVSRTFDTTAPVVTATSLTTNDTTPTLTGTVDTSTATITVTVNGQTATGTVSGTTWTATLGTALAEGTFDITVSSKDTAGNTASATNTGGLIIDTTVPVATLDSTATDPTSTSPVPFSVSFSENVTGFDVSDLTVTGGTVGNFVAVDAKNYTFNVTVTTNGAVTAKVNVDAATDVAGNKNAATAAFSRTFTGVAPTVLLATAVTDPTNDTPIPVTVTFSSDVTGFDSTDFTLVNATVTNFVAVNGSQYKFDLVPTTQGTVSVSVAAGKATDTFGTGNAASATLSRVFDSVAPTGTINPLVTNDTTPTVTGTITGAGTAVEVSANLQVVQAVVTGNTWTATFLTPLAEGTYTVTAVYSDAAGNQTPDLAAGALTIDITAPTVNLTSTLTGPTNAALIPVIVSFSETITGFTEADITVGNGTISNFAILDEQNFSFDITPTADGAVTASIAADAGRDVANNASTASNNFSITSDRTSPTTTISSTANDPTTTSPVPFTVTFGENVTDFVQADVVVTGGTIANFTAVDTKTFTFDVNATTDATVTVNVAAGVATDTAGNGNLVATQFVIDVDLAPTATVSTASVTPTNSSAIPFTVTFDQDVTGFIDTDVTIANGTIANFVPVSKTVYTFDVVPTADGAVTVSVAADVAIDSTTNGNTAAAPVIVTSDRTGPAVVVTSTSATPTNTVTIPFTVTFDEAVPAFVAGNVTIVNGTLSSFATADSKTFTFDITPAADGDVIISVAANVVTDAVGNGNTAGAAVTVVADSTVPTATITSTTASPTNMSTFPVTVTFSEDVTGFVEGDVLLSSGALTNFTVVNATTYTFDVTVTTDAVVVVGFAASAATDLAGNASTAPTDLSITVETVAPTATITSTTASPTNVSTFPVTVTFSEDVSGFVEGDVLLSSGALTNFTVVNATTYTFDVTVTTDAVVVVGFAASAATDLAGNASTAPTDLAITVDTAAPTATITSTTNGPTTSASFPVTITFNEAVTGFLETDLAITNGSVTNYAVNGNVITFDVTATADGPVIVGFAAGVAFDLAGNANLAPTDLSITVDRTAPTGTIDGASISGTAADATTSVTLVEVSIFNGTLYFDGTTFSSATEVFLPATGTTAWSYAFTTSGTYTVNARLTDAVGNTATITNSVTIP